MASVSDNEARELEDPTSWDYEGGERRPGAKQARAVVSVAFPRADFERVSECAEQLGMRTSEFIREGALEKAARHRELVGVSSISSTEGVTVITRGRTLDMTRVSTPFSSRLRESMPTTSG